MRALAVAESIERREGDHPEGTMAKPIAPVPPSPYTGETEEAPTAAKRRAALVSVAAGHTATHQRTLTLPGELAKTAGGIGGGR